MKRILLVFRRTTQRDRDLKMMKQKLEEFESRVSEIECLRRE